MAEADTQAHRLAEARRAHSAALERCDKAQRTYPKIYLLNEYVSIQNASDGRVHDGGSEIAPCSVTWDADAFTRVARHLEADTGARMFALGLDPTAYGIRF